MNNMPQEDEAQITIIDDTENDNPLDGFLVDEAVVRQLFWYLVKRYTCLQPLIRVSQIMRDLNLTFMELNCAYNTLRRVFEEAPDLLVENDIHRYVLTTHSKDKSILAFTLLPRK